MSKFDINEKVTVKRLGDIDFNTPATIKSISKLNGLDLYKVEYKSGIIENYDESRIESLDDITYVEENEMEPFVEMATIATVENYKIKIAVNPDTKRKGSPYFKAYNSISPRKGSSKVARFHFLDEGMEYHSGDGYLNWKITQDIIDDIREILQMKNDENPKYTNWNHACYHWNLEFNLIPVGIDKFMNGDHDKIDHPSYVPSTTPIPKTWNYDHKRAKAKKSHFSNDIKI